MLPAWLNPVTFNELPLTPTMTQEMDTSAITGGAFVKRFTNRLPLVLPIWPGPVTINELPPAQEKLTQEMDTVTITNIAFAKRVAINELPMAPKLRDKRDKRDRYAPRSFAPTNVRRARRKRP